MSLCFRAILSFIEEMQIIIIMSYATFHCSNHQPDHQREAQVIRFVLLGCQGRVPEVLHWFEPICNEIDREYDLKDEIE